MMQMAFDAQGFPFFGRINPQTQRPFQSYIDRLTRYEECQILGSRSNEISRRSPPWINIQGIIDPLEISKEELRQNQLDYKIRRRMPNGTIEDRNVNELWRRRVGELTRM